MLDSVLVVEDGAASESKSGKIVLKSAVDEKEEDAKGSHRNQSQGITFPKLLDLFRPPSCWEIFDVF